MEKFEQANQKMPREERIKLARAWEKDYEDALDEVDEQANLEELVDIALEKGILDRLVPEDQQVRKARQEGGNNLLDLERDDPKLWWQLLYAVKGVTEDAISGKTLSNGFVLPSMMTLFSRKSEAIIKADPEAKNPFETLGQAMMDKIKKELEFRGIQIPEKLLPIGAKGIYENIEVEITGYSSDGLIAIKATNHEDMFKLDRFTVNPAELDHDNFKLISNK